MTEIVSELRNQWLGWKWIVLKTYAFSMEDKLVAEAFYCTGNYGRDGPSKKT